MEMEQGLEKRLCSLFEDNDYLLVTVRIPRFKLQWTTSSSSNMKEKVTDLLRTAEAQIQAKKDHF